jgi:hypothetical protein
VAPERDEGYIYPGTLGYEIDVGKRPYFPAAVTQEPIPKIIIRGHRHLQTDRCAVAWQFNLGGTRPRREA